MGNKSAGYNSIQTRLKCDRFSLKADVAPVSARFVPKADIAISVQHNFWEKALQENVLIQAVAIISSRENAHIRHMDHMGISHLAV